MREELGDAEEAKGSVSMTINKISLTLIDQAGIWPLGSIYNPKEVSGKCRREYLFLPSPSNVFTILSHSD